MYLLRKNKVATEIKTVLLVSNTAIGDTLMATPAFRAIKKNMPDAKCVAILNPANADLFSANPYVDDVVLYDGRWGGFLKTVFEVRRMNVDVALLLHSNEPQATPLAVFGGAYTIIKIPNDKNPFAAFHTNPKIAAPNDRHGVYDRLEQLKFLNIETDDVRMELFLKEEWEAAAKEFLQINGCEKAKLIGFQIGASTLSRMWFEDRWAALATALLRARSDVKIVLTGSPKEREICERIKNTIGENRVINAAGALPLGAASALIGELDVFITPDTGPMHIAIALGIPSVALYAVANPIKSGAVYDNEKHIEIKKPRTCDPCVSKLCRYQECMLQIEPLEVMEATLRLL